MFWRHNVHGSANILWMALHGSLDGLSRPALRGGSIFPHSGQEDSIMSLLLPSLQVAAEDLLCDEGHKWMKLWGFYLDQNVLQGPEEL